MAKTEILVPVEGMSCGGCVRSVTNALNALGGVEVIEVTLQPGAAKVQVAPAHASRAGVVEAILDAGFDVPAG